MMSTTRLWSVVLAGGDGRRMATLTQGPDGQHVPKQFCRFGSRECLLERTLRRAAAHSAPENTLVVVQEAHRQWWEPLLASIPSRNILVEPSNQGTAVALLRVVSTLLDRDRDPHVLVMPSDHEVEDEDTWRRALRHATVTSFQSSDQLVLVAVDPQEDPDYGWLVPGRRSPDGTHPVLSFVEKPTPALASDLARRGGLCSTFAFAASARALLKMFLENAIHLVSAYEDWMRREAFRHPRAPRMPRELPVVDFSRDVLELAPHATRITRCPPCGWTDLGTPARLQRWIERCARLAPSSRGPLSTSVVPVGSLAQVATLSP